MKLYILNGPNLNLLGIREPVHYGSVSYEELMERIRIHAAELGIETECYQSNYEGGLVDEIQKAYFDSADGIIINPGAYTHTSIALLDAVRSVSIPTVEVHISDISKREPFRRISYIGMAAVKRIIGHGTDGYMEAMDFLKDYLNSKDVEQK